MVNVVQFSKQDRIIEVNTVFSHRRNQHYLTDHLREVLFKEGVVRSRNSVRPRFLNPFENNSMFAIVIDPRANLFNQRIEIIVKPDHDPKDRKIHLFVSIGQTIIQKDEDRDDHKSKLRKIIRKEEHDIEKDLRHILRKYKKNMKK